jgi:hypothetical protein
MKTDGASGGPIWQAVIPGPFLMARWWMNGKAGVMAAPATLRVAMWAGVMEYWSVGLQPLRRIEPVGRGLAILAGDASDDCPLRITPQDEAIRSLYLNSKIDERLQK